MQDEKLRVNLIPSYLKQTVKSRLFRGFYTERRYVSTLENYRDIVTLHKSEQELEKLLNCVKTKAQLYNDLIGKPNIFIGITDDATKQSDMLDISLWVNLDNLAFGQYWFSIKTLHFLDNEVILKLKIVRPVDLVAEMTPDRRKVPSNDSSTAGTGDHSFSTTSSLEPLSPGETTEDPTGLKDNVNIRDFVELFRSWSVACKKATYEFLAHDINKENIKQAIRFIALLFVSVMTFTIVGIKHMGIFVLHFMHASSQLIRALTPIATKIVDFISKIVGGVFILIAMLFGRNTPRNPHYEPLQYNPKYVKL